MKIPYIRVKQRGEIFFAIKLSASFLKTRVNFHFRDPYRKFENAGQRESFDAYVKRIERLGIDLKSSPEGIQRRLQETRIFDIKKFLEVNNSNCFPNSIILSVDISKDENSENQITDSLKNEVGFISLPDDTVFTIIDGQHRLAGLYLCDDDIINDFEFVAILLINTSLSTAAKLFADINGKQKPVNRSLIYDLYEDIDAVEMDQLRKFHTIAQNFYNDSKSPLFRQIKMLGIGQGAISQAFFIDYAMAAIKRTDLYEGSTQAIYDQLFYYFRAFQKTFPQDWPVPFDFKNHTEVDEYSEHVLKVTKSHLCKTNGFGAILNLFPDIYLKLNKNSKAYLNCIFQLKEKISWRSEPGSEFGTGKKFQDYLVGKMRDVLMLS